MNVLVYGAAGSQQSFIPHLLLTQGHSPHLLVRHVDKVNHLAQKGVAVHQGDMGDVAKLKEVSKGMDAVSLLIPFFGNPSLVLDYGRNAIDAAKAAGVQLIVWNASGAILPVRTGNPSIDVRIDIRDYLQASGVPHIILQPTAYMENLLGPWTAPFVKQRNQVAYPTPFDMPIGWIATQDVCALVVAALQRPQLAGSNWVVSGPDNLNGTELAHHFSVGLGRPITFYEMPPSEFGQILDQAFGPGAGKAAAGVYQEMHDYPERRPQFYTDMRSVLAQLPVPLTSVSQWVKQYHKAFGD